MQIWVDADACPAVIKDILFRVADRLRPPPTSDTALIYKSAFALPPRAGFSVSLLNLYNHLVG
ncbi:hypothetical protein [Thiobacillus sedimenti]|uniref:YaiI/YqxD family protein n=1 Tax=Thiobacillus sedimenti TaxID=3110231 RepID=A0ABZ1CL09_9PROT|nr:hypothetical protein [Thiobacillus sp. SCUT-2]WRS39770.1 hypothetical protein VA613_02560 [Thiobacillus sp. SCUT-2]